MGTLKPVTGYLTITDPDHPTVERDTTTCGHCQRVIWVKPGTVCTVYLIFDRVAWAWKEEPGACCRVCMRPVCLAPWCHDRCRVWERMIEEAEAKERLRRAVGV